MFLDKIGRYKNSYNLVTLSNVRLALFLDKHSHLGLIRRGGRTLQENGYPIDSKESCSKFEIEIRVSDFFETQRLVVNANWTLKDVCDSLEFLECTNLNFSFKVNEVTIGRRAKK